MKKNVLALSISAALCGLGMVGSAHAINNLGAVGPESVGAATQLKGNNDGIGHNLIIPYYTAQGKNATAFTLTNTSSVVKAVKVRFRGAENSDDVLDFQVFLSPKDVWTASVSQSASGTASITTSDKSCTKPAFPATAVDFKTSRLSAADNVGGTREGYIEIFNMADVTGALATAMTHVAGVPANCAHANFVALDTDANSNTLIGLGLALPTTGLTANWIIINTATGTSWSGQAAATQALDALNAPATGNLVYWPQMSTAIGSNVSGLTADPLLAGNVPVIAATMQDLPDMSTPYISGLATNPNQAYTAAAAYAANEQWASKTQAAQLTASLAVQSSNNDFYADSAIGGATDWAFTMPTRRYNVAVKYGATPTLALTDYTKTDTAVPGTVTTATTPAVSIVNYFDGTNTTLKGNVACVTGITATAYNREEGTSVITTSTTFSPSTASPTISFCGEAGVWALGQTVGTTGSAVLLSNITNVAQAVPVNSYGAGWLNVATPGLGGKGLPVVGVAFSKASSDPAKTYGWSQANTSTRIAGFKY